MKVFLPIALVLVLIVPKGLLAQADLYDIGSVREMRLSFDLPNWDHLLDSMFLAGNGARLIGDLEIDGTLIPNVGVRYKGFSSYSSTRVKNPFNIKLNYVHAGQDYQGYDKIKLSNVIQDPSFLREALSYEVARKYMPASLANFANVYVNDTLIGLYTNVEAVNKEFTEKHFNDRNNTFFKGNPEQIDLNGENANLSDSPGADSTDYYDLYSIESEYGWGELLEFINVLNQYPDSIDHYLNVDRALWMHAFNYAVINFDSYVGYAQNYYIFMDKNERWNPILWDMNMSFASFRLADASLYWNGFSIPQAITMDPLQHYYNFAVYPRPFMLNLFINDTYRKMYLAHMRTIMQENFADQSYYVRAEAMRDVIEPHVLADTNKFYSDQDFYDNLDQTVNDLIDYPGIAELMDQRSAYLNSYTGFTGQPTISDLDHFPQDILVGSDLSILAEITDADSAFLAYRSESGKLFTHVEMKDDGLNDDGSAGDGVYGARITAETNLLEFYIYAENDSAGAFSPKRAAYQYHSIVSQIVPGDLVINEFMANNNGAITDEEGDADDWIELYNPSAYQVSTAGLYLSDEVSNPTKWALPTLVLEPNEYLVVWADEQGDQGGLHANFKLSSSGETLTLAYADSTVIDSVRYFTQYPISTTGRFPNGTGQFVEMLSTFSAKNNVNNSEVLDLRVHLFPNPSSGDVNVIVRLPGPFEVRIFGPDGRELRNPTFQESDELLKIDTKDLAAGLYQLMIITQNATTYEPFIHTK